MKTIKNLFSIIFREFRLFKSNSVAILVFIVAPIVYSILVGSVYKDATVSDLPIIVVDLDNTPTSKNVIDALDDNQYIAVREVKNQTGNLLNEIMQKNYHAVVTIPERFEADIQQKRYPEIDVDVNAANMLTANYVSTGVQTVLGVINTGIEIETLKKKGISQSLAEKQYESFKINVTRFFNPSSNYLLFLYPGMLGTIMQQVFLIVLALSFSKEYEENTFKDLLAYSKNPFLLTIAKSAPYWIIGMALWFPLIRIFFPLFHVDLIHSLSAFWLLSALFIVSLTFMGTAVSAIFKTQLKATEVLMVIATPSFIISGQTWPLFQMPQWVQWLANAIPLTHYLEAFRKLVLMKAELHDIMPQVFAILIQTGVFLIISIIALKIKIRRTLKA